MFIEFLRKQIYKGDMIGDFARETLRTGDYPASDHFCEWVNFLKEHNAGLKGYEALDHAWGEYNEFKSHNTRA